MRWKKAIVPVMTLVVLGTTPGRASGELISQLEQRFDALHGRLNDIASLFEREALEH